jgi:hypothetical protein
MNKKLLTGILIAVYLSLSILIMGLVNGFSNAKWFDGGLDMLYGVIIIYLLVLLYYVYKTNRDKNIFYVSLGLFVILMERIFQIFLQEIDLKTNYQLSIISWSWIFVDVIMVVGFLLLIKGLWGVKNG